MPTQRVAIAGATGYAGEELIRLLLQHPKVQLTCLAASARWERPVPVSDVFPQFARRLDLPVESLDPGRLAASADFVLLALPHGVSMDVVPPLLAAGRRVIDLAGDFRLKDAAAFATWYGSPHRHPELLGEAVYGIPELAADAIATARLVANPGCYATAVILALAPLLRTGLIEPAGIIVDAKSGVTGAGRKAEAALMFGETEGNLRPYKVNRHQHTPEIIQALAAAGGAGASLCFVPHLVPLRRGILSTIYARLTRPAGRVDLERIYRDAYGTAPFVRLRPEGRWPTLRDVEGTNYCDLALATDADQGLLIAVAAIDNLMKGAAGQAVHNMNLMHGWPETMGLS